MQVKAVLKGVRLSPQKGRLVADTIRGLPVVEALRLLSFCSRRKAAQIIRAVVFSAASNAEHNQGMDLEDLLVSRIFIEKGPVLKRFSARARGRGARILKPTSHIYVFVGTVGDL
ncbi:50S ribosomal protein L22 [Candidatus Ichthyocystis hellenicum]|uniref:50S ribosomal protein L22 n=1 Tax=Candidatus Ichthyocystis hellenicum TaxID=1561003 RepID=UPI000B1E67B7|nr:50S ribosomal protein L22 [Candidatus Ichthyocystis hellenicum]